MSENKYDINKSLPALNVEDQKVRDRLVKLGQITAQVMEERIKITILEDGKDGQKKFSETITGMQSVGDRGQLFLELVRLDGMNGQLRKLLGGGSY